MSTASVGPDRGGSRESTIESSARSGVVWVVTVGDELLAGDITDTNAVFLAQRSRALGATVVRSVSVRDRIDEIAAVLQEADASGAAACLVSGGLGPTTDDLTAAAVAEAAGVAVQRDDEALSRLRAKFKAFGREMPPANEKQADFPAGAEILANPIGSAEGFAASVGRCRVFCMPGVPREMRKMTEEQVVPRLRELGRFREIPRRVYRVLGHGESAVAQRIEGVLAAARKRSQALANMFVHYRASMPQVTVILEGVAGASGGIGATEAELAALDGAMIDALSPGIYGIGDADLAGRVVAAAREAGVSIAAAESCTGGGLGALITAIPGASACFSGAVVAYGNAVKVAQLGVPQAVLDEHGAVSEPVARAMAEGGRRALGADLCVAITGIAGPDGGTPEKPVGTVHVAVCRDTETTHKQLKLRGDRGTVQRAAAQWALKLVWDRLAAAGLATVACVP
ncbi:MAG: CinA family nicotinamide mononucleotide deamidase-related protein [Myxococcota bacterium]